MRVALAWLGFFLSLASVAHAQDAGRPAPDAGVPQAQLDAGVPQAQLDADVPVADADAGTAADVDAGATAPDAAAPSGLPRVVIVDAIPYGIDPIVAVAVTRTMREAAQVMGYDLLSPDDAVAVENQAHMPYPPAPADLWQVAWHAHAARAAFARVYAAQGQYVVELVVASTDGGGPFFNRGAAPAETLLGVVADLVRQTLPPPGVHTAPQQVSTGPQLAPPGGPGTAPPQGNGTPTPRPRARRQSTHWAAVAVVDAAFGLAQDFFFNFLAGARLDYRVTPDIRIGLGLLGGVLRGKGGAVGNMLAFAQIEDRLRIATDSDVLVPLRFAIGYLPFNGPWVRLAAGVCIPFDRRWEVTLDILSVDFWVLPDHTVVSLDAAVEIGYRF